MRFSLGGAVGMIVQRWRRNLKTSVIKLLIRVYVRSSEVRPGLSLVYARASIL